MHSMCQTSPSMHFRSTNMMSVLNLVTCTMSTIMMRCQGNDFLKSWSTSYAPWGDSQHYVTQDAANGDYVWIIGRLSNLVFRYQVSTDSFQQFSFSETTASGTQTTDSVMVDNIIYLLENDGPISTYDTSDGTFNDGVIDNEGPWKYGCVTAINNILLVVDGQWDGYFWYYNITNSTWSEGPNLHYSRYRPGCIVHNNYLYIVSGRSIYIERMNLTQFLYPNDHDNETITNWEVLDTTMSDIDTNLMTTQDCNWSDFHSFGIAAIDSYIYILGGICTNDAMTDVLTFDTQTQVIND